MWHRARGDRVVLVSGSIRPIVEPLARHLDVMDVIAPELEERGGVTTGALAAEPVAGRRKADAVVEFAARERVDLGTAWGYADSMDDVPMLEETGNPAVVNPGRKLERVARARGWDVWRW
jgi:HAD superfamily hydrolase (TIGR01490 family)